MDFNWDDIELDDTATHNSRYYFANLRHSRHDHVQAIKEEDFREQLVELALSENENENEIENNDQEVGNENKIDTKIVVKEEKKKKFLNLLTPSRWHQNTGAVPKQKACQKPQPKVNKYEELQRKQEEEYRKMREFRSRPVPNFQVPTKTVVHHVSVSHTPMVLKRSREAQLKRMEKLKELEHKSTTSKKVQKPFELRTDRRAQERKKFDENVKKLMEAKRKQEEEERKKMEEAQIKEIRKATLFKARPNPLK